MNYQASNFSFGSFLSGINKTLGVAKEVIPLWQQTKPLISNVRNAYSLIKNVNSSKPTTTTPVKQIDNTIKHIQPQKQKTIIKSNNSPQFFM